MTKTLGRDDFLSAAAGRPRELVEVPDLGGAVWLQAITTPQLLELRARAEGARGADGNINDASSLRLMTFVLSLAACDEEGVPLFREADLEPLMENRVSVLMSLGTRALELSGVNLNLDEVISSLKKTNGSSSTASRGSSAKRRRRS